MATNEKIKLDITSAFDPGGFTRADKAVKNLGQTMNRQGEAVNKVVTAFGDANTSVGKFAKSAQNLMGAFAGGGIWGLAAAGVAILATKFMEAREAAKKLVEEQQKAWRDDLIKKTENGLSSLLSKHGRIADEIERGAKAADKIAKAYEALAKSEMAVVNAEAEKRVAVLEGKKQSALSGENDPVKRMAIELDFERQIFETKKESAELDRKNNEALAASKVAAAEKNLALEKTNLANLKAKEDALQDEVDKSAIDEYIKKNPMPGREGFTKTINTGSGAMGIGGGRAVLDESAYQEAMNKWWKGANELAKPIEELRKKAEEELQRVRDEIKAGPSSIKQREIDLQAARNEQKSVLSSTDADREKQAIQQTALSEKQLAFDKTLEDYQKALDKRVKVEDQITKQEEKISKLKEKEKDREDKRAQWNQNATTAKSLGAAGWNQQQTEAQDAKDEADKGTRDEAKWVANAKKRMSTGAKLSKKEMARIGNFDQFQALQGPNPFDPGKAATAQLKKLDDNLNELKGLRTDLQNSLKVN